ncbi:hypothetical protein FOL47_006684 [Perkinsus chesapeaki]|uniref:Uncharacterized protein n=1 Tax=Perkinsus chesapeaki TaxID=330153 RepID=A0A7J6LQA4_PERCH|nr:hypothetical protein FOL47_006684 [Perkinsus chesapeaki]
MAATATSSLISIEGSQRTQAPLAVLTDIYSQRNRGGSTAAVQTPNRRRTPRHHQPDLRRVESAPMVAWGTPGSIATTPRGPSRYDVNHNPHHAYQRGRAPASVRGARSGRSVMTPREREAALRREGLWSHRGRHSPPRPRTTQTPPQPHRSAVKKVNSPLEPEWSSGSTGSGSEARTASERPELDDEVIPREGPVGIVLTYTYHCGCGGYIFRKDIQA